MPLRGWFAQSIAQPGAPGLLALTVSRDDWRPVLRDLAAAGARLVALWASGSRSTGRPAQPISPGPPAPPDGASTLRAAFLTEACGIVLNLHLTQSEDPYPGLEGPFPAASRM